jgi:hypothetical protein
VRLENDSGQGIAAKIFGFCHENPFCPFRHIWHPFLTEQAAFFILIALVKTLLPRFLAERRIL